MASLARDGRGRRALAARIAVVTPRFRASLARLGIAPGSSASRHVAATIRALESASDLPAAPDVEVVIPPMLRAHARRVGALNLWLWYRLRPNEVVLWAVTASPPVPTE